MVGEERRRAGQECFQVRTNVVEDIFQRSLTAREDLALRAACGDDENDFKVKD